MPDLILKALIVLLLGLTVWVQVFLNNTRRPR